ncbi:hypothetical protein MBLNU13_g06125t3 [Cladosporium sp. NU13]
MAEDEKEPVPLSAYDFDPDDLVTLLVGPKERKMLVHGPQITAGSEFLAAALKREWIESQTREIKLPEEEPEIMAYYIEHVNFGKLPSEIYITTSPGLAKESGYKLSAQLYVLAERLLDSKCRNHVVRDFLRLRNMKCTRGGGWKTACIPFNIIYWGTMPGSPARRLLVDIHASFARKDWYPRDVFMDPAFKVDLLRKLLHNVETFGMVGEFRQLDLKAEDYRV